MREGNNTSLRANLLEIAAKVTIDYFTALSKNHHPRVIAMTARHAAVYKISNSLASLFICSSLNRYQ